METLDYERAVEELRVRKRRLDFVSFVGTAPLLGAFLWQVFAPKDQRLPEAFDRYIYVWVFIFFGANLIRRFGLKCPRCQSLVRIGRYAYFRPLPGACGSCGLPFHAGGVTSVLTPAAEPVVDPVKARMPTPFIVGVAVAIGLVVTIGSRGSLPLAGGIAWGAMVAAIVFLSLNRTRKRLQNFRTCAKCGYRGYGEKFCQSCGSNLNDAA